MFETNIQMNTFNMPTLGDAVEKKFNEKKSNEQMANIKRDSISQDRSCTIYHGTITPQV